MDLMGAFTWQRQKLSYGSWPPSFHRETNISYPAKSLQFFFSVWRARFCTTELTAEVGPTPARDVSCGPAWPSTKGGGARRARGKGSLFQLRPAWLKVRVMCQKPHGLRISVDVAAPLMTRLEDACRARGTPASPAALEADERAGGRSGRSGDRASADSGDSGTPGDGAALQTVRPAKS